MEKYIPKKILDIKIPHQNLLNTDTTLRNGVNALYSVFSTKFQPSEALLKKGYVAVFAYSMDVTEPLLAINVAQNISRKVFDPLVKKKLSELPQKLPIDFKKVFKENISKIAKTRSFWMDPMNVLYVQPIPKADVPLKYERMYSTITRTEPLKYAMV